MAEFLLKVADNERYKDGDVVCAFNQHHIRSLHAQRLCNPWQATVNGDGLLPLGTHVEDFYRHTHQYRSERISRTELRRVDQWTSDTIVLSEIAIQDPKRPDKLISVDVEDFFARRCAYRAPNGAPKLAMFGQPGSEVIYHGRKDFSNAKFDLVWAAIEAKTEHREADYPRMPLSQERPPESVTLSVSKQVQAALRARGLPEAVMVQYFGADRQYHVAAKGTQAEVIRGGRDGRHFFAISVDDFDDATAEELISPLMDEETVLAKRKHYVVWQDLPGLSPETRANVADRTKYVDIRAAVTFTRAGIVQTKTAG